jgi:ATP/maltotriose-dependent transcriptional regulator MalT
MILVDGYSNGIPLLIGMGELLTASQLQAEAAGLSEKYPVLPETRDQLESCEARLLLAQADRTAVADWVESRKRRRPGPLGFVSELGDISLARMLISLGDLDAAGRLLDALAASAEAGGRNGRLVEIHVLQARVLRAQGHKRAAVASLQRSLELAEPGNYTRTYIDEGEWLRELLSAVPVRLDSTPTVSGAYLARLLGAFAGTSTRREAA